MVKNLLNFIINIQLGNIPKVIQFYKLYNKYRSMCTFEKNELLTYPCINDNTSTTPFDPHYFYQGVWAFNRIMKSGISAHIDVGSDIRWVGILSEIVKTTFIDIRPFNTCLKNLEVKKGDLVDMPFEDRSIMSLSCLHVAEHIGLGRYGDRLDPDGTKKACRELSRILAVGGNLYFSLPVGHEKTYFNAHRVHSPKTIISYFKDLKLVELSGITDLGEYIENIDIEILEKSEYACALFWFKREK